MWAKLAATAWFVLLQQAHAAGVSLECSHNAYESRIPDQTTMAASHSCVSAQLCSTKKAAYFGHQSHFRQLAVCVPHQCSLGPVSACCIKEGLHLGTHHAKPCGEAKDKAISLCVGGGGGRTKGGGRGQQGGRVSAQRDDVEMHLIGMELGVAGCTMMQAPQFHCFISL
jgi:hypothetical protein